MVKKYINPLQSPFFMKYECLYGTRLHKTLVFKKRGGILLKDYTNEKNFLALRDQLLLCIDLLSKQGLCCDLDKVIVDDHEFARILFHDYSTLTFGKFSEKQIKDLLTKLQ
jgi:hypothetical protein